MSFRSYIFAKNNAPAGPVHNTFIGGAFPGILTAADLATYLNTNAANIENFQNTGTEIKAKIIADYNMTNGFRYTDIEYFSDNDGKCKSLGSSFNTTPKLTFVNLPGVAEISNVCFSASGIYQIYLPSLINTYWYQTFRGNNIRLVYLPELTGTIGDGANALFTFAAKTKVIYMPKNLKIGWQHTNNDVFLESPQGVKLYLNSTLQTINGGAEEGDVAYARANKSAVINYGVTDASFILKPENITDLSIGEVYSSAVKLNFTPPPSTWDIKFYQVYVNGLLNTTFVAGSNVFGISLTAETNYNFSIRAIDDNGNVTDLSNVANATTLSSEMEPFPIGGLLSTYNLEETVAGPVFDEWGSNNGNQGTANINQPGKINLCYGFTGGNKTFTVPNPGITTKGTFNVWVKLNVNQPSNQSDTGFVFLNNSNSSDHYPYTNGTIYSGIFTSARKTIGAGIIADRTQWHMITVTADEATNVWKYYQNAQLVITSTVGTLGALSTFTFGKSRDSFYFDGWLDMPTFYSIALSQSDITKLFNQGAAVKI